MAVEWCVLYFLCDLYILIVYRYPCISGDHKQPFRFVMLLWRWRIYSRKRRQKRGFGRTRGMKNLLISLSFFHM